MDMESFSALGPLIFKVTLAPLPFVLDMANVEKLVWLVLVHVIHNASDHPRHAHTHPHPYIHYTHA